MNYYHYIPTEKFNDAIAHHKKIILVGGCFDIIHFGHIQFLEKAKKTGDYLIIALEPDERITQNKKRSPTHTQSERAYNLLSLRYVDEIIMLPLLNTFEDYLTLVQTINPHIIAITDNDPQQVNKQKQADAIGAQLIIVTNVIGTFSSSLIYNSLY
jgi:FAD synthetase